MRSLIEMCGLPALTKGIEAIDPTPNPVAFEILAGRHHQVCVNADIRLQLHPDIKCPEGGNVELYRTARQQERLDHYAAPTLPTHRRWG